MPDENKHSDLFRRLADGDLAALSDLYDEYAPVLRGIAQRILPLKDQAEEVLDEVFDKLWKRGNRRTLQGASSEAALILATRSAAVRRLRAQKHLSPRSEPAAGLPGACLPGEREVGILASRQELVRRVLSQLPAPQKKTLELVLFQGMSEEEIAQTLNAPLGRVKDQIRASLSFARQRMHTLMGTWTAEI
jgi:RNA polymerase sigma-70 factor, ECF subfamily